MPEQYGKAVKQEYRFRLVVVWFWALSFVGIISFILVFPVYTTVKVHYDEAVQKEAAEHSVQNSQSADVANIISKANTYMSALSLLSPLQADEIIGLVVSSKPSGVTITSISITKSNNGANISLSGVASTRNTLLAFDKNLEGVGQFSNVSLPVSFLAEDTLINYSIQLISHISNP